MTRCLDTQGERALWAAVLYTAVKDALSPRDTLDKRAAVAWIAAGGAHFRAVCDFLDVDPARLRNRIVLLQERPDLRPASLRPDARGLRRVTPNA